MPDTWAIRQVTFNPARQYHDETVLTIGNGYLGTRGAFEEGYPLDRRATFLHGVFDDAPVVVTELANAPDWLPFVVYLNGERFGQDCGTVEHFERVLDLRRAILRRTVRWRAPSGAAATLTFERFASLADPHSLFIRCRVMPEFSGTLEFRAGLHGDMDNEGLAHWRWMEQGLRRGDVFLRDRTRASNLEAAYALRLTTSRGREVGRDFWDVENAPTLVARLEAVAGQEAVLDKQVTLFTSRDAPAAGLVDAALARLDAVEGWEAARAAQVAAWDGEWARSDVVIEGDDAAQLAVRFNLYQLLIAAPRHDDRVSIGAKTLSGFGYRGHAFWDTEVFMLPFFTYTAPEIAKNLLNYRQRLLAGARRKAQARGFEGAEFPWESADTGDEVTPAWVPDPADRTRLIRIWTGDIEIHLSADIAYAAYQYWLVTGDDEWLIEKGAELILDTAKFWASRAEWNAPEGRYEYTDVIGPDEYHEHVNNNYFTNRMAQWNLQTAFEVLEWLQARAPARAAELAARLDLSARRLAQWREVIDKMYLPATPTGLCLQFEDYLQRREVNLAALEPRSESVQQLFGMEGINETQAIKQPDVLMLLYLLRYLGAYRDLGVNYEFYTPRTDYTFGSSLGPSIQAILACALDRPQEAYEQFLRAARADLDDVRGNAGDGIHGASAGGTWQAVVFGFAGLLVTREGWSLHPALPAQWRRLAFKFYYHGRPEQVDLQPSREQPAEAARPGEAK